MKSKINKKPGNKSYENQNSGKKPLSSRDFVFISVHADIISYYSGANFVQAKLGYKIERPEELSDEGKPPTSFPPARIARVGLYFYPYPYKSARRFSE